MAWTHLENKAPCLAAKSLSRALSRSELPTPSPPVKYLKYRPRRLVSEVLVYCKTVYYLSIVVLFLSIGHSCQIYLPFKCIFIIGLVWYINR